jgi:tetratricopeptide (TPR) repeat protein
MSFRRVPRWMMAAVLGWCAVAARPAVAADATRLTGESQRTRQRFVEAADLEKQGRWADAVESYLRLLDEAGDDLVPDDADSQHYLPARLLVHRRLAGRRELLPPYRARVEARAQRLLEQGESQRDRQALEHVVDNFFCSRSAEAALHLLGDLACERGDFERARRYWQLLEPPAASHALAYPDSKGDVALPRGKQVLARLLAGERDEAETALRAFRKTHPNSTGYLAGRSGNLGATLQRLLDAAEVVRVPSPAGLAPAPTTFAGDATRNGVLSGLLPPFIPKPRYPPIPLPGANPSADDHRLVQRPLTRPAALAFYPVIAHGQVFVADTCRVTAYDLATGKLSGQFDVTGSDPRLAGLRDLRLPLTSDARYTVTIDGERIFARLGQPKMRADRADAASRTAATPLVAAGTQG